jgi:undecaprenyl diphosphate synthase
MTQSTSEAESPLPLHVAIIMDGNGRWAESHGLPRGAGHRAGAIAVHRVVRASVPLGVTTLTLFALSADNWKRPETEVGALLELFREYLQSETAECVTNGVRLRVIGRRDRLPTELVLAIEESERATAGGTRLGLRLAIDYSSREAIVNAARAFNVTVAANGAHESFGHLLEGECSPNRVDTHAPDRADVRTNGKAALCACDVDLLIRTGGEQRLSDFLLWECAYAEIVFVKRMWPDFDGTALRKAIDEFRSRDRRFGGVRCRAG